MPLPHDSGAEAAKPDQALVELVRLIARQAARDWLVGSTSKPDPTLAADLSSSVPHDSHSKKDSR